MEALAIVMLLAMCVALPLGIGAFCAIAGVVAIVCIAGAVILGWSIDRDMAKASRSYDDFD